MKLVPKPASALLLCVGYNDVVDAARDLEAILEFEPAAVEGIDHAIVDTMRMRRGESSVAALPQGRAWLYVDLDGANDVAIREEAECLLERLRENDRIVDSQIVSDPAARRSLWRVREDGAGLSSQLADGSQSWPGWEDSAVHPLRLADYLADLRSLMNSYALDGVMYGHFGAGCMHVRITYDLRTDGGVAVFREFTQRAAELVVRHGGSLSGEHGDGRARSQLLPVMYSPELMGAFARYRQIWDPAGLLNPGSITDADPIDDNLALTGVPERPWGSGFDQTEHPTAADVVPVTSLRHGQPDLWVQAVQSCIGVGRCRSDSGMMCPSYRATRDEKDSTRGRARVLQEMVRGARSVDDGWRSEEVRESLDLCLSCKACSSDCPAGVDMSRYKSEFFHHFYRGRIRPASHLSMGWLPRWLKVTGRLAPLVNLAMRTPLRLVAAKLGGVTTHRRFPAFASTRAWQAEVAAAGIDCGPRRRVKARHSTRTTHRSEPERSAVLFVDSFTKGFRPEVAGAAARVLSADGAAVTCSADVCCGLTWISTGQLDTARTLLRKAADALDDGTDRPIVVIEPSCAAALHRDLTELVPTDRARRVARRVRSFASHIDILLKEGWVPSPHHPIPRQVVLQTHCHEYAAFGSSAQRSVLAALGIADVAESTSCCGVAGNFGFEADHFDVSLKVAEQSLMPALQKTPESAPALTDGFSCGMQVDHLDPARQRLHLAQLLDPGPIEPTTFGAPARLVKPYGKDQE
ncbi:FAD-binding and (Fe-S)-binding domain-containing protein [Streptomyces sp. NPDC052042]|uniref:FAD-binding and (Fe-S)-binding domain-containing protein n=1 Tax=Streptomyces sp. NPDC052042 TaxID=3365683 RepID=UPI0037D8A2FB